MADSTERLNREDRGILEREVDIATNRQVRTISPDPPDQPSEEDIKPAPDRTKDLIAKYDDYIDEVNRMLDEISSRSSRLEYRIDPVLEAQCAEAIAQLFEGQKNYINYDDYRKVLELEALISKELIKREGGIYEPIVTK